MTISEQKQKSFTTIIENLTAKKDELDRELQLLKELRKDGDAISHEIAQKIQDL
jgi:hypothetical protein